MKSRLCLCCFAVTMLLTHASIVRAQSGSPSIHVFPLLADGAANGIVYRSSIRIIPSNHASPSTQCTLTQRGTNAAFVGLYGDLYVPDVFGADERAASITSIALSAYLPWEALRSTSSGGLAAGYATLSCTATAHAQLQITLADAAGIKLGETAIPPAVQGQSFEFLVDRRDGTRLGFSLINDSEIEGEYSVIARDEFHQEVDRVFDTLAAWDNVSRFVDEVLRLPSTFVGTIEVVGVSRGRNYAVGLQFTGPIFSVVSPIVRDTPLGF